MPSAKDLEDLQKLRKAWFTMVKGRSTWPVAIDEDKVLRVLCADQPTADKIAAVSDDLAAKLNSKTNQQMLVTRVEAHPAELPTLILARRISEIEEYLIEIA